MLKVILIIKINKINRRIELCRIATLQHSVRNSVEIQTYELITEIMALAEDSTIYIKIKKHTSFNKPLTRRDDKMIWSTIMIYTIHVDSLYSKYTCMYKIDISFTNQRSRKALSSWYGITSSSIMWVNPLTRPAACSVVQKAETEKCLCYNIKVHIIIIVWKTHQAACILTKTLSIVQDQSINAKVNR